MNNSKNSCYIDIENAEMRPTNEWIHTVAVIYYITFLVYLVHKHWHQMEPVHYFEFNALLDWCILMTTRPLQQLEHLIGCQYGFYMFCIVNQIVQKWSNFCLFTDIILCQ